jgi:sugar O-acyltransferase (sialic acid O-acetyltransferase NeuD family)
MSSLIIFGAGGHGKVVAETAKKSGTYSNIAFADDLYPNIKNVNGLPVIANFKDAKLLLKEFTEAIVAVGDSNLRFDLVNELLGLGFKLPSIIHPAAVVSESAVIADACVLFASVVIQASTQVGLASIVNTSASIDHDCVIGNAVHIAPGVHIGGDAVIGDYSLIGIGASVLRGTTIGSNTIIGAGAAVINDIDDSSTAVGVPARVIKKSG